MLSPEYVEAVAELRPSASPGAAERWLKGQGFRVSAIRAGLLVQGDQETFERAFGVDLGRATPPVALPIPAELAEVVAAITIPAPRRYS
jgi:hypothetical protein